MDPTAARCLSARLADLLSREQIAMAEFLVCLSEFDRQRLWEPLGFISLWHYLHRELGLSRAAAFHRKEAARLLQRFPAVEAPLRDGRLCLSSVAELAKVLTAANEADVLPRFFHRSAREAREVVAELVPRVNVPERVVVTAISTPSAVRTSELVGPDAGVVGAPTVSVPLASQHSPSPRPLPGNPVSTVVLDSTGAGTPAQAGHPAPALGAAVEPLDAELRRLHVTVSRRFLGKLEAARDALAQAGGVTDVEAILEAGLDLLLARQAKRRGQVKRPLKPSPAQDDVTASAVVSAHVGGEPPSTGSAHVPAEVRRAVWERDGCRCQWRMSSGGVCGSTRRLQLDHITPRARGGPSTIENLRVLCAFHNDLAARKVFGEAWMQRAKRRPDPTTSGRSP